MSYTQIAPTLHSIPLYDGVQYKEGNEKFFQVTDKAAKRLTGILDKQGKSDKGAMRIAVVGGGCSGLSYKMDIVDAPRNKDILVCSRAVRVVVDPKSALFVTGGQLDYSDDLQQGGFKVINPNASSTCSCGESFAV
ncbi:MAG: iron-sulfur cluster assembly accessory protein [Verrucomicrobiota bacterium]|nr:iron-sulfur cluster assembly accessory protein [Verrucomicrobiota bacterium]